VTPAKPLPGLDGDPAGRLQQLRQAIDRAAQPAPAPARDRIPPAGGGQGSGFEFWCVFFSGRETFASQVVLSFGTPFAVIPLVVFTSRMDVMSRPCNGVVMLASGFRL
jgi:hypothetical protein